MKIKKGDNVQVMAGKDKGKTGKVMRALPATNQVIVEGVNLHKRHQKTKKDTKQGGGIVEITAPIHVSNVQLLDPKTNKPTRVAYTVDVAKGTKVRVAKKGGAVLK
jgi:large subunit ribosomal protein L24